MDHYGILLIVRYSHFLWESNLHFFTMVEEQERPTALLLAPDGFSPQPLSSPKKARAVDVTGDLCWSYYLCQPMVKQCTN